MQSKARQRGGAYDVVIAGGGMVGSLFACALGDSLLKVALLDRQEPPDLLSDGYDSRVSAINLASRAIFEAVEAWGAIARFRVSPVREMHVWEGPFRDANPGGAGPTAPGADPRPFLDAGRGGEIHFDAAEIGEPCLGYIIENSVILSALRERLQRLTNVHVLCPVEVATVGIDDNAATVTLKDSRVLRGRLLVGADGAQSTVRQAAGIETRRRSFGQKAIVATLATERAHRETAWQRFLPTGPLAFLPLDDPHTCSIVWSADTVRADQLLALDDAAFVSELNAAFGDVLGGVITVSERRAFPLALSHATAYVDERVALIGDAAHTVHPLAGQGVNLGFLDAATLAQVLADAVAQGKDIGARPVLRRYERWRKGDNLTMLAITDLFKRLFGNDLAPLRRLRGLGLDTTDRLAPVKRFIMRRASGLQGDLPELAQRLPDCG